MKSLVYPSYTNKNVFKKESAEKFNQYHLPSKYKLSSIPSIAKKKKKQFNQKLLFIKVMLQIQKDYKTPS
jgi:hypothetical protein